MTNMRNHITGNSYVVSSNGKIITDKTDVKRNTKNNFLQ